MKYRITDKMPANSWGFKPGDVVEITDLAYATLCIAKGRMEPADMEEAKQDTQIKHARHK